MKSGDGLYLALSLGFPLILVCCAIAAMLDWLGLTKTDVENLGWLVMLLVIWWYVRTDRKDRQKPEGKP